MNKKLLVEKYNDIALEIGVKDSNISNDMNNIIRTEIVDFLNSHNCVAIYGNGRHTKMLMKDYVYELKDIKYIIDNFSDKSFGGYAIITENQIENCKIDGVIISSIAYKEDMKKNIRNNHPYTDYLDINEKLEEHGIIIKNAYYQYFHPSNYYADISKLLHKLNESNNDTEILELLFNLFKSHFVLKDFETAKKYLERCAIYTNQYSELIIKLDELINLYYSSISFISDSNTLMLCIDGLRNKDFLGLRMPKLLDYCTNNCTVYTNAFSCSTSTYESLVPAYSQNDNLNSKYYEHNEVKEEDCSFITEALNQNRRVFFYTGVAKYINSDYIIFNNSYLTASEKIWFFVLDALYETKGLFYIHIEYESHFPYINPCSANLITNGSNIMFDYLESMGGRVRTDYEKQLADSLDYLDNMLVKFISNLNARWVMFADHGNILIDENEKSEDICFSKYSYHDDLIRIPIVVKSPEYGTKKDNGLISLIQINDIIISLLNRRKYKGHNNRFIKTERSRIYNPDFNFIYKKNGKERELEAFEYFVFEDGYNLAVYESGKTVLINNNIEINDPVIKQKKLDMTAHAVTVCELEHLQP